MYLLIAIWGTTRKDYSAMKLTLFLFAGSAVLIVALVLTYWQVGADTFDLRVWAALRLRRRSSSAGSSCSRSSASARSSRSGRCTPGRPTATSPPRPPSR